MSVNPRILKAGDPAPAARVTGPDGREYALESVWQTGPVLLVFLRHFG